MTKYLTRRSNSREERLILAYMLKRNAVYHGIEDTTSPACHVTQCLYNQKAKNRQDMEPDKTSRPALVIYFLQQGSHLKTSQPCKTVPPSEDQVFQHDLTGDILHSPYTVCYRPPLANGCLTIQNSFTSIFKVSTVFNSPNFGHWVYSIF